MTLVFVLGLWLGLAALYLWHRGAAVALYLVALPAFPFYWAPLFVYPLNALTIQRTLAIGLALGLVAETVGQMIRREPLPPSLALELAVAAMICLWSVSAFQVTTTTAAVRGMLFDLLDLWVPLVLAERVCRSEGGDRLVLKWLTWPALAVAGLAACEYVTQRPLAWELFDSLPTYVIEDVWTPTMRATSLRVQATFGQPIFLGFHLACAALLALMLGTTSSGRARTRAYLASVLLATCSLLPMARGAVVGLAAAVLVLAVLSRARWGVLLSLAAALGVLWLGAGVLESVSSFWSEFLLTVLGRTSGGVQQLQLANLDYRVEMVRMGIKLVQNGPPFGYGDLSVGGLWPILDVANVFIGLGITAGTLGLGMFVIFLAGVSLRLFRLWQGRSGDGRHALLAGVIAALVLVAASWLDACWPGQFTQIGWVLLGLALGWRTT